MRLKFAAITTLIAALSASTQAFGVPIYTIEQAVAVAQAHNPEIEIARKKVQGAHGGWVEARSGYLPWLSSTGLVDKRQQQTETRLRDEDYNAILKLEQNLYTGGAVPSQVAIARLSIEKQNYELQETASRVAMDVRIAFNELLLNRAKIGVRQNSVRVLEEELKSQQQSFSAGIVGNLNVQRAEVALANEQPELFNAQTQLKNSYLRLGDLFGTEVPPTGGTPPFEISGELQYQPNHPDLNACLARADASRPVIKARQKDIEIEDQQYKLDRSAMRPHVRAFSGYEVYSERDPEVGQEFNYGGVVGINATWNIFDGFATKGRMRVSRQFSNVVSCSPVLRGTVSARAGFENATVDLYGINPALHARTTDILHQLIDGNFDDFRNNTSSIIIGSRLAELLQASVGDTVQLLAPNGEYWRFTVAAIARAGIGSIDSTRVYSHEALRPIGQQHEGHIPTA